MCFSHGVLTFSNKHMPGNTGDESMRDKMIRLYKQEKTSPDSLTEAERRLLAAGKKMLRRVLDGTDPEAEDEKEEKDKS